MKTRALQVTAALLLAHLAACASTGTPAEVSSFDTRTLDYSGVVLEFVTPATGTQEVDLTGAGDGMAEGAKMMAVAPIACLRGADPYTAAFCIGLAPFFPFLSAARVQDEQISLQQLASLYEHIEELDVHQQFVDETLLQAGTASLPVVELSTDRTVRLRAVLGPVSLVHDGYKGGQISMAIPYDFELIDANDVVVTTVSGQISDDFDVDTWRDDAEPEQSILRWLHNAVGKGLRSTLVEWQPELALAPVRPAPVKKRNIIGIMQNRWPTEDTLTPQLEWQALHELLDPELMAQVSDVTYELRIAGRYNNETYYFERDLAEPRHQVATDLAPCAAYIWQARARFRYRDNMYTTSLPKRRWSREVWITDHYPLTTPGPGCKSPRYM